MNKTPMEMRADFVAVIKATANHNMRDENFAARQALIAFDKKDIESLNFWSIHFSVLNQPVERVLRAKPFTAEFFDQKETYGPHMGKLAETTR